MKKTRTPAAIRVLDKALDVIEAIKNKDGGIGLSGLAREAKLPKATVYRIAATLESRGYLDRREDGAYRLATKLFDLRRDGSFEQALSRAAERPMQRLVDWCAETVSLGILDGGEVVVINTRESPRAVRLSSKVGNRRHLHATALGKILLAGLSDEEALRLVQMKGLPCFTVKTLVSQVALFKEIRLIRRQGYALDDEENEVGGRCVATPIVGSNDHWVAALSISGPAFRMELALARSFVPRLKEACKSVSEAIRA